jgi:hypothetical protein
VRYSSDLAEHHAVRKNAGIFDLSHIGVVFGQVGGVPHGHVPAREIGEGCSEALVYGRQWGMDSVVRRLVYFFSSPYEQAHGPSSCHTSNHDYASTFPANSVAGQVGVRDALVSRGAAAARRA